jgi:galactitol-specific phosphotransferase system IIC component
MLLNLIIILGAATLLLIIMTIIFQMIFRRKRRKIYLRLHRYFGIAVLVMGLIHGTASLLYFYGVI